ncbi:hemoblobin-interacting domain-containing protein [Paenibacillus oryzisoli]|uniref:Heme-binding protein Shr-like Hb-interacting domain-containing protein n=1 Tax=Paenibacillus oryzisoli TaxID=1850517 RepID=A0A198A5C9_9BACL|nr:hemoblobin-interacting domain-containing protein [Paenibacillus oryzisoli]OAS16684.1 hypothetical protein A8708_07395 [Paenibacillus oryzisoli]
MLKKNQGFRKLVWGRLLSFLLVLAVVISPFSASFSGKAYADTETELALVSAIASDDNSQVVLTFNRDVSSEDGWSDKIELKGTYDGYFYDDFCYATMNENTVTLNLDSSLIGDKNQIRIKAGAFEGQNSDIISDVFGVHDLSTPQVISSVISSDQHNVTLTFNGDVQSVSEYVYKSVDYKLVRGSEYIPFTAADQVVLSGNTMTIQFQVPLTGKPTIRIAEESLQFVGGNLKTNASDLCIRLNANPIEFDGYELNDGDTITNSELNVYLSQDVISTGNADALKAAVTIAKYDAITSAFGAYTALAPNDTVSLDTNSSNYIYIRFFESLTPGSYKVKIAANALKNSNGLITANEITSDEIVVGDHNAPVYQGFEVNADGNVVTLTFDKAISLNPNEQNCSWVWGWVCTQKPLAEFVYFKTSENGFQQLTSNYGTVQIEGKKLIITLNSALSGATNKIFISERALVDEAGNVLNTGITTNYIDVTGIGTPQYVRSTIDNLNHDWNLYFDKNIKINSAFVGDLKAAITLSKDGQALTPLNTLATITYSENKVVLHFVNALVDSNIQVNVPAGAFTSENNVVLTDALTTEPISPNSFYEPKMYYQFLVSQHSVKIYYSTRQGHLVDNTINGTGSHLKDYITYSTDKGVTFLPLQSEDSVMLDESSINVYFDHVIEGNLQIKVAGDALKDSTGVVLTTDTVTEDLNTTNYPPYLTGSFFSNVASVLTFEDNATWRSKIQRVVLAESAYNWSERTLSPSEYTISAGKLIIKQGVLEKDSYYQIRIYSDGFNTSYSNGMSAMNSQDSYYITPVKINTTSGITAKVKIAENQDGGHLHVIFQLMNDQTPVSIVAAESDYFRAGTFTANFNVADAATNAKYMVRAFIVSEYSNSPLSVGANLATQISDAEYDLISNQNE